MVSAAKLKRASDRVVNARPFANKMSEVLGDTRDRGDVMELVDVHIRAARAKSAALRDHDYSPCFHKSDMKC